MLFAEPLQYFDQIDRRILLQVRELRCTAYIQVSWIRSCFGICMINVCSKCSSAAVAAWLRRLMKGRARLFTAVSNQPFNINPVSITGGLQLQTLRTH